MTQTLALHQPNGSLEQYLSWAFSQPNLSQEDEKALLLSLKQDNNIEAAKKLVISHIKYVAFIAKGFTKYGLNYADLIQEGTIGLMKAIQRFDITQPVRLVTYAKDWIRNEIQEYIVKNLHMVKRLTSQVKKQIWRMLPSSQPTHHEASEIAEKLDISVDKVYQITHDLTGDHYLEEKIDHQEPQTRHIDVLPAEDHNPEEKIIIQQQKHIQNTHLHNALATLNQREKSIIMKRFPENDTKRQTLKEIACEENISIERVRQIEKGAYEKLAKVIKSEK